MRSYIIIGFSGAQQRTPKLQRLPPAAFSLEPGPCSSGCLEALEDIRIIWPVVSGIHGVFTSPFNSEIAAPALQTELERVCCDGNRKNARKRYRRLVGLPHYPALALRPHLNLDRTVSWCVQDLFADTFNLASGPSMGHGSTGVNGRYLNLSGRRSIHKKHSSPSLELCRRPYHSHAAKLEVAALIMSTTFLWLGCC